MNREVLERLLEWIHPMGCLQQVQVVRTAGSWPFTQKNTYPQALRG